MKIGLVNMEFQDLETHLNRSIDFTGSRVRMSYTTSFRRCWDIIGGSALFVLQTQRDWRVWVSEFWSENIGRECQIYLSLREALQFFAFTLRTLHFVLGECEMDSTTWARIEQVYQYPSSFFEPIINDIQLFISLFYFKR